MGQRRIRVRLPKLWAMNATSESAGKNKKNKRNETKNKNNTKTDCIRPGKLLLVKRVSSIVSGVFRHKKSATSPKDHTKKRSDKISDCVSREDVRTSAVCGVKSNKKLSKKRESLQEELRRVQLKILIIGRRLKRTRSTRKDREHTRGESDWEHNTGEELCKKRILMGGKCKPLNFSGSLQYDRNGVLLPEVIP